MCRSRAKSVIASCLLLASSAAAASDYGPMTLFHLLTTNDVAVVGTVANLTEAEYELALEKNFRATAVPHSLGVIRFETYPPSTRSGDFSEGMSLVLFAVVEGDGLVRPLGRASEGEIERDDGSVYVRSLSRPPDTLSLTRTKNGTYAAYRIDADVFDQAVEGFYSCYRPIAQNEIERLCSDDALESYRGKSWLTEHLSGIAERLISEEE